ncbi:MAG: sensor histidine kinase [Actinomycetota bacterium]
MPESQSPVTGERADARGQRLTDLLRAQRSMVVVRWIGVPWALFQVLFYEKPYPAGFEALGLALVAILAVGNLLIALLGRRPDSIEFARPLALGGLALDIFIIGGFVWLYTFDPDSALWAVLFILPLEGAISFSLSGALGAWAATTLLYTAREVWGSSHYDYPLLWNSVSFRMGLALIIALVAGLMSRDLIKQKTRLGEAVAELRRVDRIRSGLISTLAHDVRNPLTSIRGVHQTLLAKSDRIPSDTVTELYRLADRQAERIERLAADLLDLARLDQGKLNLAVEDVPLQDAVESALSYVEGGARFDVRIDHEIVVRADPGRLQQILVNLLTNAVSHGAPPFVIEAERDGSEAAITVADGGIGIRGEDRELLFEPFSSEGAAASVGLGLAIVHALVGEHGGRVTYEPNDPSGARFTVILPAANVSLGRSRTAADGETDAGAPSFKLPDQSRA